MKKSFSEKLFLGLVIFSDDVCGDGDGKTDVAVYRNGVWYILQSSSGNARYENFGNPADTPIPSIAIQ